MRPKTPIYGLLVEFVTARGSPGRHTSRPAGRLSADGRLYALSGRGPGAELGMRATRIPFVVLMGGLVGAGVGFFMQYYSMAIDYTFNVRRAALQ